MSLSESKHESKHSHPHPSHSDEDLSRSPPKKSKDGNKSGGGLHVGEVEEDGGSSSSGAGHTEEEISKGEDPPHGRQSLDELAEKGKRVSKMGKRKVENAMEDVDERNYPVDDSYFSRLARLNSADFCVKNAREEPIWVCSRDDHLVSVLKGMQKRNISSVPVVLKESDKLYGILDLYDVCQFIIQHFGSEKFNSSQSIFALIETEKEFGAKTVDDVVQYPFTKMNPFHPIRQDYSALTVVETLAREEKVHRVPIVSDLEFRHLVNLVTESQLIRFLHENMESLGKVAEKPVEKFINSQFHFYTVTETTMAMDAFDLMVKQHVPSVAVVEEGTERLKGIITLRDIKAIHSDASMVWRMKQTCRNFMRKLRYDEETKHQRPRRAVYVIPEATLKDVVEALVKNHIHQIYICDEHHSKKTIGCITIKDVAREIIGAAQISPTQKQLPHGHGHGHGHGHASEDKDKETHSHVHGHGKEKEKEKKGKEGKEGESKKKEEKTK